MSLNLTDKTNRFTLLRRVPSLIALRAFESVARHGSCTRAAAELNVTVAAVSQRLRLVEEYAGRELFRRHNRRFILTEAGNSCLRELRRGFDHILNAMEELERQRSHKRLNISVPPSFAARWFVPHINSLSEWLDDCDICVTTSPVPFLLDETNVDIAIMHGSGDFLGQRGELLIAAFDLPVASPEVLARHSVESPADLRHHRLIHEIPEVDDEAVPSWKAWLAARGVSDVDADAGLQLSNPNLVIEAALAGFGVALVRGALATREIASGQLIALFAPPEKGTAGYYLLRNPRAEVQGICQEFCECLRDKISADILDLSYS